MRRTIVAAAVLAIVGIPATALAGGGCHAPATQQDATDRDEAAVVMADACFDASITTIDPGTTVSFVNKDMATHNVSGNGWGHYEDLNQGDRFGVTFDEEGIYPFACNYHAGMTGAIVVGDGIGPGNGLTVSTAPPKLDPVDAGTVRDSAADASPAPWIAVAAAGGLVAGAAGAIAVRRATKPAVA